jgi:hypothetical protein
MLFLGGYYLCIFNVLFMCNEIESSVPRHSIFYPATTCPREILLYEIEPMNETIE